MRIATGALRPRNDRGFTRGQCKAGRRGGGTPPYGGVTRSAVGRDDVGSELSAASGRGSEVSEWPRSKFLRCLTAGAGNFGHRNRVIGPYESVTRSAVVIGRGDVGIAPYGGGTEIHLLSGGRGRTPPLRRATRGAEEESPSHGFVVPAPFRQGGMGTGDADCEAGVRTGFAMTVLFFVEAVLRTVFAGVAGGGATGRKLLA